MKLYAIGATAVLLMSNIGPVRGEEMPAAPSPAASALRAHMAQMLTSIPGFQMPVDHSELDQALDKDDLGKLRSLLNLPQHPEKEREELLNWEKYAVYTGGGFGISFIYANDLWVMGNSFEKAAGQAPENAQSFKQQGGVLKRAAIMYGLYAIALTEIDGKRCADASAPLKQNNDIAGAFRPIWMYANQLPSDERLKFVGEVYRLEFLTAPLRSSDVWLCSGGLKQTDAALAAVSRNSSAIHEAPRKPGDLGANFNITVDPDKYSLFASSSVWPARQAEARVNLRGDLNKIVGLPN